MAAGRGFCISLNLVGAENFYTASLCRVCVPGAEGWRRYKTYALGQQKKACSVTDFSPPPNV